MSTRPKQPLGLAAEYAVASELPQRGIPAALLMSPQKRVDILTDRGLIEVKAMQIPEWPSAKGPRPGGLIVLVDYQNKPLDIRPDFYVLTEARTCLPRLSPLPTTAASRA
jgi:hypothetical protein